MDIFINNDTTRPVIDVWLIFSLSIELFDYCSFLESTTRDYPNIITLC